MAMVVMALYGYYAITITPSRSGRPCQTSSASSSASRLRLAALRQLMLPSAAPSRQRAALILPRLRHDPHPWEWLKGKERRRDACVGDTGLGWRLHWLHEVPSASTEARPAPAPSGALEGRHPRYHHRWPLLALKKQHHAASCEPPPWRRVASPTSFLAPVPPFAECSPSWPLGEVASPRPSHRRRNPGGYIAHEKTATGGTE